MFRNHRITIRWLALTAACSIVFSLRIAHAGPRSNAQGLWVANENYISEFQGSALESSGAPDARHTFGIKDYLDPFSIAFDHHDNLWITDLSDLRGGDVAIMEVRHTDVASLKRGSMAKRRLITPNGVGVKNTGWLGIDFDAAGDLFVSNTGQQFLEVPRNRLEKKRPSPSIVVSLPGSTFIPGAIRFGASDNLWVVAAGVSQLLRFAPGDRAASGPPEPGLTVNLPDFFIVMDLSFDRSGNLWLAGLALQGMGPFIDEVEMISAADLAGTGSIFPSVSLTITSSVFGSGPCLGGIDFDRSGDLWVSVVGSNGVCEADTQLVEFTPSQLSTGGNLTPSVTIGQNSTKTNLAFPGPIRFGPSLK